MEKEAATPSNKGAELESAEIRDNIDAPNEGFEYKPLFDDEGVADEALKGDEASTAEKPADAGSKADDEPKGLKKDDEEPKEADNNEDGKEDNAQPGDGKKANAEKDETEAEPAEKPPAGYVPQAALHQERQLTKSLKQQIAAMSAELQNATAPKEESGDDQFKDFKVLTDQEFDDLLDEDPDAATKYQYKYTRYQSYLRDRQERQMREKQMVDAQNEILNQAVNDINEVIPGYYSGEAKELVNNLVDFASEKGVHPELLSIITDPRTRITTADGNKVILGPGAGQIVKMLKSTYESMASKPDEAKLRESIEAELRPKIEAEVQQTFMEKFKDGTGDAFKSLDQIAASGKRKTATTSGQVLTEAEFSRLPEAEQVALLGG